MSTVDLVSDDEKDAKFFRALEDANIYLNEKQLQVVRHFEGGLCVDSVGGSGKSQVITSRVSYLISQKLVLPESILLVTFTNRAAKEMMEKACKIGVVKKKEVKKITSGTFHAVFLNILKENGMNKEVWSSDKSRQITIKTILRDMKIKPNSYKAEDVLALIASYKNRLIGLEDAPDDSASRLEFKEIWKRYEKYKLDRNYIDFDDMLFLTYKLFSQNDKVLQKIRDKFHYIMVDEFQDTSTIQNELIKMIAYPRNNVVAVGDLNQTIFSFGGATIRNILDFEKVFPNSKRISMDVNYRSESPILGLANDLIGYSLGKTDKISLSVQPTENHPKFIRPYDSEEEAKYIVHKIKNQVESGVSKYKDFAVLYRTNANSRAIFEELLIKKIPFIQYGASESFYSHPTNKPVLDYLRLSVDPKNMSAIEGVLNTMYIAKDKISYIKSCNKNNPINNPIEYVLDDLKPFQRGKVSEKINIIEKLKNLKPETAISYIRESYEEFLLGETNETNNTSLHQEVIKETLDELSTSSRRFQTIEEYLIFVDMIIKNSEIQKEMQKKPNNDAVRLMTIHKSKGLEFDTVFLLSIIENVLPHKSSLEECSDIITSNEAGVFEERRLAYVGITRAKYNLEISVPRYHKGREATPSRFIVKYLSKDDLSVFNYLCKDEELLEMEV